MELSAASHTKTCAPANQPDGNFVSALSHEIRNQLTLIDSSLQLIARDCPSVADLSLWPQIRQDLSDTIRMLKDASALSGCRALHREQINIAAFMEKLIASAAPLMQECSIRLCTLVSDELTHAGFWADPLKLKEAIVNLILNAADAISASANADCGQIQISVSADDTSLSIHVRDNGTGIPKEYIDTLFEPCVTHKPHGTGFGLAISKAIAEQHGGSLTVSTSALQPDTYTDFCLRLPFSFR